MEVAMSVQSAWAVIEARYRQGLCARRDKECAIDLAQTVLDRAQAVCQEGGFGRFAALRAEIKGLMKEAQHGQD
jgi:hypothetical protein